MHYVKELDNRFYIAESTQQGAGQGLFAVQDLSKDSQLDIVGVVAAARDCVKFADNYNFVTKKGECWVPLGFGALVNHSSNPAHQNVEYTCHETPAYRFIRDIKKDEEILTSYGHAFANVLAIYQTLEERGNIIEWQQECEDIADSKEGKELYEKVFESIFAAS